MDQNYRRDQNLPYIADETVICNVRPIKVLQHKFNNTIPTNMKRRRKLIKKMGINHKEGCYFEQPFYCGYGKHITIGENFYCNRNCFLLDVAKITIGDNVQFGPNVLLCTAGHPVHPQSRNSMFEYGIPITIGDNVWLGANVVVLPGVNIGNNVVIGAGSVVTKDIPDDYIAVGNPCKLLRKITEDDRRYYFKDREFDAEAWDDMVARGFAE